MTTDEAIDAAVAASLSAAANLVRSRMPGLFGAQLAAAIRKLATRPPPEPKPKHRGARAFDDDRYCSADDCWCQQSEPTPEPHRPLDPGNCQCVDCRKYDRLPATPSGARAGGGACATRVRDVGQGWIAVCSCGWKSEILALGFADEAAAEHARGGRAS